MLEFSEYIKNGNPIARIILIVVSIFSFFIRKIIFFKKNKNNEILIISVNKLGDTVFTIPAIKLLQNFGYQKIKIICYPESQKIYNLVLSDIEYEIFDYKEFSFGGRIPSINSIRKIHRINSGKIFDLTGNVTSALLSCFNAAENIYGFNEKYFKPIYNNFMEKPGKPHLMDLYSDVVKMFTGKCDIKWYKEFEINYCNESEILIHPFAGWKAKEWGIKKFIELAEWLNRFYKIKIIFPKGALEIDTVGELEVLKLNYSELNNIDDLIREIKECSVLIGNDSGPVYIASLLGKPTFTIYGPTNPEFSLPFGDSHDFIQNEIKCTPAKGEQYCFLDAGRKCPAYLCMLNLDREITTVKVNGFLEKLDIKKLDKNQ